MDEAPNELICAERGRAGLVRLNRPKALNALTLGMIRGLEAFTHGCAKNPHIYGIVMEAEGKGFCAGGDIRVIRDWSQNSPKEADRYYIDEYQHNWTLQCFRKPHVALINGVTMGGGVGICLYGTHRVAGENISFAMPETGIGFFPDIGASWFLPRMPGKIGPYLGLTGRICGRADCFYLGVATHCIPAGKFEAVRAAMIEAEPIDPVLDGLHEPPGESALQTLRGPIDRIFSASSLDDILKGLEREEGEWRDWAQETLAILSKRSPLSLKVTFEALKRGSGFKTLKEALIVEFRLATRMIRRRDFLEGVRAAVVDKDQSPKWEPPSLAEVSDSLLQSLFAPLPEGELELKDYWSPSSL
jgi:enoyl-CoA hydratase